MKTINFVPVDAGFFFNVIGMLLQNEPSLDIVKLVKSEDIFSEVPFGTENTSVSGGQSDMLEWLETASLTELTLDARSDYMSLLVGTNKIFAAPWSSCYLTRKRMTFQEKTLEIRDIYRSHGLEVIKKNTEPDDHIGIELEFISYLLSKNDVESATDFARKHVNPWIHLWSKDVVKHAATGYYRGLALMAAGGVEALLNN
ncbi:MAG: molecular chaperone [Deferribacterales bacterium]